MLRYAEISIGGSRPACPRCGSHGDEAIVSAEGLADRLAAVASAPPGPIALVGGDTFARDDWRALLDAVAAVGARGVRADAGASLADERLADEVLSAGVSSVRFCLAGSPEADSSATRALGTFASVARRHSRKAVASVEIAVCRHNLHGLPSVVAAVAEAGAFEVTLLVRDTTLATGPSAPWLAAAADSGTVNRIWVRIEGFPPEALPGYGLHFTDPFTLGAAS